MRRNPGAPIETRRGGFDRERRGGACPGVFHVKHWAAGCALLLLLAGCAPAQPVERAFFAMDTVMSLRLYAGGDEALLERAEERVRELEGLWSVTDEASEVWALNRTGAAAGLAPETADLLDTALGLCARTGGALDISTYPILRAWGFTTGEYRIPTEEELAALLPLADYTRVRLDGRRASLAEGMEIDLGSVAKGYTGDALSALLREHGVESALLDLGGNIQAVGAKPDGSPWRVAIRDPEGTGSLGVVEVVDQAVVTSGGYERYFEEEGVRYWHILDPAAGTPARSGLVSVTVVGDSGAVCDGLSTALFVMGRDRALEHWREYRDFEAVLVAQDGVVTVTGGLAGQFTLTDGGRELCVAEP